MNLRKVILYYAGLPLGWWLNTLATAGRFLRHPVHAWKMAPSMWRLLPRLVDVSRCPDHQPEILPILTEWVGEMQSAIGPDFERVWGGVSDIEIRRAAQDFEQARAAILRSYHAARAASMSDGPEAA